MAMAEVHAPDSIKPMERLGDGEGLLAKLFVIFKNAFPKLDENQMHVFLADCWTFLVNQFDALHFRCGQDCTESHQIIIFSIIIKDRSFITRFFLNRARWMVNFSKLRTGN